MSAGFPASPGGARRRSGGRTAPRARRKRFSNHWKHFFQSLENCRKFFPIVGKTGGIFQPLENNFPIIGKNALFFPTIGKIFSNRWKTSVPRKRPLTPPWRPAMVRGRVKRVHPWWNWQTRKIQVLMPSPAWRFESSRVHHFLSRARGFPARFFRFRAARCNRRAACGRVRAWTNATQNGPAATNPPNTRSARKSPTR